MRAILARFAGMCSECGAHFPKGAPIRYGDRRAFCGDGCAGDYRRRVAADDDDMGALAW